MATKIRLQRHGHKDYAFYPIVVADSRAPRDGRFIERIGSYNPNTNPATISLNFERALHWVNCGAIPTDTVRNILSREGVMLMKHLQGGVKKGAFDEAEAQKRFDAWKAEKDAKIEAAKANLANAKSADQKKRLEEEAKKNEAKSLCVFPEGRRTDTGKMGPFKKGAFKLAVDFSLPVVPITIDGSYDVMPRSTFNIRPGKIRIMIHKPIFPAEDGHDLKALSIDSFKVIHDSLPEKYK